MAQTVVGASSEELRAVRETMRRMLKENGAAARGPLCRLQISGTGPRLQGKARLDHADLRRGRGRDRPDRAQAGRSGGLRRDRNAPVGSPCKTPRRSARDPRALSGQQSANFRLGGAGRGCRGQRPGYSGRTSMSTSRRSRISTASRTNWQRLLGTAVDVVTPGGLLPNVAARIGDELVPLVKPDVELQFIELCSHIVAWGDRIPGFIGDLTFDEFVADELTHLRRLEMRRGSWRGVFKILQIDDDLDNRYPGPAVEVRLCHAEPGLPMAIRPWSDHSVVDSAKLRSSDGRGGALHCGAAGLK